MSSTLLTPPEAMMCTFSSSLRRWYRSRFAPCSAPSREISVLMMVLTPSSSIRRQKAKASSPEVAVQPRMATRPSRMSTPTAILS